MFDPIIINDRIEILPGELQFRFSRSGGPGGQNVNKVATKVELVFDLHHSKALTEAQKALVARRLARYLDGEGMLTISSQESRSQFQNRKIVVHKFAALMVKALHVAKKRTATAPTHTSTLKRLEHKKTRSRLKQHRSKRIEME